MSTMINSKHHTLHYHNICCPISNMSEQPQKQEKLQKPVVKSADSPAADDASGEKKLSNKELKELKKKQKAEKRAAEKQAKGIPNQAEEKAAQNKQKKEQKQQNAANAVQSKKQVKKPVKKVAIFSHLEPKEQRNEQAQTQQISQVHPAILSLTLKLSSYAIVGSIPRCKAMLKAFQRVIAEYQTPANTTLTRHLTSHLGYQIDYLKTARPLSVSMGNAIRWLKQEISMISIDTFDANAKAELVESIDTFIREKIDLSDRVIIQSASGHISNGSTVLTFGNSNVLRELFLYAHKEQNKRFTVIIVDSRPLFEGKKLAEALSSKGLKVQYVLINALTSVFQDVDTVFLGAHAMLSNGFLYSRVGTALIAMKAKRANIPVLVCCESIKFSDRVLLDSVTLNELGDCSDLVDWNQNTHVKTPGVALRKFIETHEETKDTPVTNGNQKQKNGNGKPQQDVGKDELPLANWKDSPSLNILNIMYDLTPPEYIQKIITEVGALPPSSVPVILREYKAT